MVQIMIEVPSMCLQVMANLVMEQLLPILQKDLLPRLKSKKAERKRVWFAVSQLETFLYPLRETMLLAHCQCR